MKDGYRILRLRGVRSDGSVVTVAQEAVHVYGSESSAAAFLKLLRSLNLHPSWRMWIEDRDEPAMCVDESNIVRGDN